MWQREPACSQQLQRASLGARGDWGGSSRETDLDQHGAQQPSLTMPVGRGPACCGIGFLSLTGLPRVHRWGRTP